MTDPATYELNDMAQQIADFATKRGEDFEHVKDACEVIGDLEGLKTVSAGLGAFLPLLGAGINLGLQIIGHSDDEQKMIITAIKDLSTKLDDARADILNSISALAKTVFKDIEVSRFETVSDSLKSVQDTVEFYYGYLSTGDRTRLEQATQTLLEFTSLKTYVDLGTICDMTPELLDALYNASEASFAEIASWGARIKAVATQLASFYSLIAGLERAAGKKQRNDVETAIVLRQLAQITGMVDYYLTRCVGPELQDCDSRIKERISRLWKNVERGNPEGSVTICRDELAQMWPWMDFVCVAWDGDVYVRSIPCADPGSEWKSDAPAGGLKSIVAWTPKREGRDTPPPDGKPTFASEVAAGRGPTFEWTAERPTTKDAEKHMTLELSSGRSGAPERKTAVENARAALDKQLAECKAAVRTAAELADLQKTVAGGALKDPLTHLATHDPKHPVGGRLRAAMSAKLPWLSAYGDEYHLSWLVDLPTDELPGYGVELQKLKDTKWGQKWGVDLRCGLAATDPERLYSWGPARIWREHSNEDSFDQVGFVVAFV